MFGHKTIDVPIAGFVPEMLNLAGQQFFSVCNYFEDQGFVVRVTRQIHCSFKRLLRCNVR